MTLDASIAPSITDSTLIAGLYVWQWRITHATDEHGDCKHWCEACKLRAGLGLPTDAELDSDAPHRLFENEIIARDDGVIYDEHSLEGLSLEQRLKLVTLCDIGYWAWEQAREHIEKLENMPAGIQPRTEPQEGA